MKIISHRGNVDGKNIEMENSFEYLQSAIDLGFDVEVDLWIINNIIYFGHDKPHHLITQKEFNSIKKHSWFHCKNLEAITYCLNNKNIRYFWHQQDDFTLTSNGYIWTYPGKEITNRSILVTFDEYPINHLVKPYAICTDNPRLYI
jgi:hypothetical protein